ncbi:hypothetical protein AHAS_Ahas04G0134500 [Arachis hypogaea]
MLSHVLDAPSQFGEKLIHENNVVNSKGKRNLNPQFEEVAADADVLGFKIAKVVLMLVILTTNVQSVGRISGYQNVLKETPQQTSEIDRELITELLEMIDTHNVIAQSFRRYPLLFSYGEDGYQLNIPYRGRIDGFVPGRRTRVSLREFIRFQLQIKEQEDGIIHKCRRLFQQFVVDCFTMIESQRLYEIRMKQSIIRGEVLQGIEEAMRRGDDEASSIRTRVILLSSFTGGRCYMFNRYQDAMAICKHFGYPDLFLTITCNPNWPEFQRFTKRERISIAYHPDISCRVFHAKLECLLSDLKEGVFFGPLSAGM